VQEQNRVQNKITELNMLIDGKKSKLNEIESMFDFSGKSEQEKLD
jgi:hypothetical protein